MTQSIPGFIIGHANMDADCLASMVLARYLHPELRLVRSQRMNPSAVALYNMFTSRFDFLSTHEIPPGQAQSVERVIIVDTRSPDQVLGHTGFLRGFSGDLEVYDHHENDARDFSEIFAPGIPRQESLFFRPFGANASQICLLLRDREVAIDPDDAVIALAGIYADTGSFSHSNVRAEDFEAASWLLGQGARTSIARKFVDSFYDEEKSRMIHELVAGLEPCPIDERVVLIAEMTMDRQRPGLSGLVDRVFELEAPDALFCIFHFTKEEQAIIIARGGSGKMDLAYILALFGGGGHEQAAAVLIRDVGPDGPVRERLKAAITSRAAPDEKARDLMSPDPDCVSAVWTVREASMFLETHNHAAAPVVSENGTYVGLFGLHEIQTARKTGHMQSPVRAYTNTGAHTMVPGSGLREIESLFFRSDVARVPIVLEDKPVGMLCRSDYLRFIARSRV